MTVIVNCLMHLTKAGMLLIRLFRAMNRIREQKEAKEEKRRWIKPSSPSWRRQGEAFDEEEETKRGGERPR